MDGSKIIIFTETKRGADQLTRQLRMDGWPALAIHGSKSQSERDWVLAEFREGKNPIMIATDVAARGLGILLGVRALYFPLFRTQTLYSRSLLETIVRVLGV